MAKLQKGDPAPDFALTAATGETVKLSDFKSGRLLIYFFPKAGTSG